MQERLAELVEEVSGVLEARYAGRAEAFYAEVDRAKASDA